MKKVFTLLIVLCLLSAAVLSVAASPARLVDDAELLSSKEAERIEKKLDKLSQAQDMDIVIVTVDSTDGEDPMDFADDYYDDHGYGSDGILLLVSMEDSDWWVSTTGYGIQVITDAGLDYMADQFVPYLSDGEYAEAFETFITLCEDFIEQANSGEPYDRGNLPKGEFKLGRNLLICLVIGLVVALIATGVMKSKLKSVRMQAKADDYMVPGSLELSRSRDLFLYTHVSRREKPQASSGSSTHIGSSGTSHGGGGGKF